MINFLLLISRQGKIRLSKWYHTYSQRDRARIQSECSTVILERGSKLTNFIDYKGGRLVYKRYASLYFMVHMDTTDNELLALELIHYYVEILDRYFGNVCELDLIFNFHKAYYILDEVFLAGELQESSKKVVVRVVAQEDQIVAEHIKEQKLRGKT